MVEQGRLGSLIGKAHLMAVCGYIIMHIEKGATLNPDLPKYLSEPLPDGQNGSLYSI